MGPSQGASIPVEAVNGLAAQPLLLGWNGMMWEPKRAVNAKPMKTFKGGISWLQPRRVSIGL